MIQEPVYVRRKGDYFLISYPIVRFPQAHHGLGDAVIALKFYRANLPKAPLPEIESGLDEKESCILERSLNGLGKLYEFRKG